MHSGNEVPPMQSPLCHEEDTRIPAYFLCGYLPPPILPSHEKIYPNIRWICEEEREEGVVTKKSPLQLDSKDERNQKACRAHHDLSSFESAQLEYPEKNWGSFYDGLVRQQIIQSKQNVRSFIPVLVWSETLSFERPKTPCPNPAHYHCPFGSNLYLAMVTNKSEVTAREYFIGPAEVDENASYFDCDYYPGKKHVTPMTTAGSLWWIDFVAMTKLDQDKNIFDLDNIRDLQSEVIYNVSKSFKTNMFVEGLVGSGKSSTLDKLQRDRCEDMIVALEPVVYWQHFLHLFEKSKNDQKKMDELLVRFQPLVCQGHATAMLSITRNLEPELKSGQLVVAERSMICSNFQFSPIHESGDHRLLQHAIMQRTTRLNKAPWSNFIMANPVNDSFMKILDHRNHPGDKGYSMESLQRQFIRVMQYSAVYAPAFKHTFVMVKHGKGLRVISLFNVEKPTSKDDDNVQSDYY